MKRMFGVESFKDQLGNLQNKPLSYKMNLRNFEQDLLNRPLKT